MWAAEITEQASQAPIFSFIDPTRSVGVVFLLVWFLVRLIRQFEQALQSPERVQKPLDATTAGALGKLLRASVIITGVLVALQTLGFSVSGVLAFGGIGGIAVGFAAKDLLANFFGGLMVYLDRPFVVGDWVRSPDKDIEGTVEEIGWRLTRIRTFDKRPLYVPNATFATIALENPSRMSHRRIYETIGIRYADVGKMASIVSSVKEMLLSHEEIEAQQTMIVNFNQFGPSSLDFFIYCFTKTTNWIKFHEVKQDVLLKVSDIIEKHGAEVAFPTRSLHLESVPPELAGLERQSG
jgi:MscS family membrane protein